MFTDLSLVVFAVLNLVGVLVYWGRVAVPGAEGLAQVALHQPDPLLGPLHLCRAHLHLHSGIENYILKDLLQLFINK